VQDRPEAQPGQIIRALRETAGLSQQSLATKAGVAIRTLARIEQGEDMRLGTLSAIAVALDVGVSELLPESPVSAA
jgi:transcriptional regulator with XRE-family HTH domain